MDLQWDESIKLNSMNTTRGILPKCPGHSIISLYCSQGNGHSNFDEIPIESKYYNKTLIKIAIKNFYCDFEKGISNAAEKIFPKKELRKTDEINLEMSNDQMKRLSKFSLNY
ncbi:hypothetical protein H8356DRAFT_1322291 [Neocallimastix lanati (nom. inval.)]|nr:hypothetical protein H8356DRAFT_1322291 [Neocallimastix sp. JGI-2020a]